MFCVIMIFYRMTKCLVTLNRLLRKAIQKTSKRIFLEFPPTWMRLWSVPKESASPIPFCSSKVRLCCCRKEEENGTDLWLMFLTIHFYLFLFHMTLLSLVYLSLGTMYRSTNHRKDALYQTVALITICSP